MDERERASLQAYGRAHQSGRIRVFITDDGHFVASSHDVWIEGVFTDEATAVLACDADPQSLHDLWHRVCPRPLSEKDLREIVPIPGSMS